jgi:DNA ligase-1
MTFPTLYKRTSTGKIQCWNISTNGPEIITIFGLTDGKRQTASDTIKIGKNIGRSNETTSQQQAELEAQAKWEKQVKKGYVEKLSDATKGKNKLGGISPMLAHKYSEQGHKIKFPCIAQPKLDGTRCVALIDKGSCTVWSRTRKPIVTVPHIIKALEEHYTSQTLILDGELYNHDYHDNFEDLIDLIRGDEPQEGYEVIQYHIYDIINSSPNSERLASLLAYKAEFKKDSTLRIVEARIINSEAELHAYHDECKELGYEGCMVRNLDGKYENKRSYNLQKVKVMQDAEFIITGFEEGRGKLQGHIGKFLCHTQDGKEFGAKLRGKLSRLKEYFDDHSLWEGKELTVTFQNYTKDGIPRFPVGKSLRNYE